MLMPMPMLMLFSLILINLSFHDPCSLYVALALAPSRVPLGHLGIEVSGHWGRRPDGSLIRVVMGERSPESIAESTRAQVRARTI